MATVKKGLLTAPGEWWQHLRWMKRVFWKRERQAAKRLAAKSQDSKAGSSGHRAAARRS
jgi:hypothetical protein